MNRKASKPASPSAIALHPPQPAQWLAFGAWLLWSWAALAMASRVHLVMGYQPLPAGPALLEPLLASGAAWLFVAIVGVLWLFCWSRVYRQTPQVAQRGLMWLGLAVLPVGVTLARVAGIDWSASYAEPLWLSACSGFSFAVLLAKPSAGGASPSLSQFSWRWHHVAVLLLTAAAAVWWYAQTAAYYRDYLLGFNDFGHFTQRLANTVAGRGWLMETPILPPFWDHFNPGLLLLVPLWKLAPSVHLIFAVQAVALAVGAVLVGAMARRLHYPPWTATCLAAAWLAQPALGQMNLAYSYGWHPISLAIPGLLAGLLCLLSQRPGWALVCAVLAMSMEEGVIVVVCLFCVVCAGQAWLEGRRGAGHRVFHVSLTAWAIAAAATAVAFAMVYRWSGIAEFQTARFVALGDSALEVLLSPLLRPAAFWGQIFRWDKAAFLLSLGLPCYLIALLRGWRWLLPTALPLLVLIAWDHKPATSLAFQYPSGLLPLFWLAALWGGRKTPAATAVGALSTGLLLSLFVGQLPYSSPTLLDVEGRTYGESLELRRRAEEADGRWLTEQVSMIHSSAAPVLATGRIAAHLVGNEDVETVGQYVQRREQLRTLTKAEASPLSRYEWIVLDSREAFQQSPADIEAVANEAELAGFRIAAEAYGIVVWQARVAAASR